MKHTIAIVLIISMMFILPGLVFGQGPASPAGESDKTPPPQEETPTTKQEGKEGEAAQSAAAKGGASAVGKGISTKTVAGVVAAGAAAVAVGIGSATEEGHGN